MSPELVANQYNPVAPQWSLTTAMTWLLLTMSTHVALDRLIRRAPFERRYYVLTEAVDWINRQYRIWFPVNPGFDLRLPRSIADQFYANDIEARRYPHRAARTHRSQRSLEMRVDALGQQIRAAIGSLDTIGNRIIGVYRSQVNVPRPRPIPRFVRERTPNNGQDSDHNPRQRGGNRGHSNRRSDEISRNTPLRTGRGRGGGIYNRSTTS